MKGKTVAIAAPSIPSTASSSRALLYRHVVEVLRDEILKGLHPVGSRLPTEGTLAARFGVSRHTVREALRHLRDDGLVSSRQGAGTTVSRPGSPRGYVQEIASISDLIQYAASIRYEIDRSEMVTSDDVRSQLNDGSVGQKWLKIEGLRYEEHVDRPVCRTVVYVHADYAGVGRLVGRRTRPIYELIEDLYGEQVSQVEQILTAYQAPSEVAQVLGVGAGTVLVEVKRIYRMVSGKIGEVAVNQYPSDRYTFTMTLRRSAS